MDNIAILGSQGTFSDLAAQKYLEMTKVEINRVYYPNIDSVIHGVGKECSCGVVPVENTLDGYVQRTLDMLLETDSRIIKEIIIPVQFSLIANSDGLSGIKRLYVQFKTGGQCRKFIGRLGNVKVVTTEDNMASFNLAVNGVDGDAAIIPRHMYQPAAARFGIENVTDSDDNFTRFLVLRPFDGSDTAQASADIKAAFYVMPSESADRPGILYEILREFAVNGINLISIMSRPTGKHMGAYNFYMELSGGYKDRPLIIETLDKIKRDYGLKILGIYAV